MVQGIVIEQRSGNLVIKTVVRASRNICEFTPQKDVIEQKQGTLKITDAGDGDFVVGIMTATDSRTGNVVRQKTTTYFPLGVAPVEGSTITLPSGTVVDKDAGVPVV